jgi:beta-phosphoglucomutase-like phosphatase (HAD superfamily)
MFEGIIFDVEATLVDSVSQNQRSLQDALEKSGHRVPIQTLRLYSGLDGDQTLQLAVPEAPGRERMAILEDRREIYERDYLPRVQPFVGAREVIKTLSEQGARVALATDCKGGGLQALYVASGRRRTTSPRPHAAMTSSTASRTLASLALLCASLVLRVRRRSWSATRHTMQKRASRQGRRRPVF